MKKIMLFIILSLSMFALMFVADFACSQNDGSSLIDSASKSNSYIPASPKTSTSDSLSYDELALFNTAYDLTNSLPINYVKNASVDYTSYIQKGLDANKIVKMPNFPLLVNQNGLTVSSGARIFFQNESSLIMQGNSLSNYAIMGMYNVSDVVIYSPVIVGERDKHTGSSGEWGHGINISNSKNIRIMYPDISNCWGDGIYIGGGSVSCENIEVFKGKVDNCRRNGISITDAKYVKIQNTVVSNANGTPPMCGIDIEPNNNNATIDGIVISNVTTFNNSDGGILIFLNAIVGVNQKNIGIEINNHVDSGSNYGFILGSYYSNVANAKQLTGSIVINNPVWINNKKYPTNADGDYFMMPQIIFNNINIVSSKTTLQNLINQLASQENMTVN